MKLLAKITAALTLAVALTLTACGGGDGGGVPGDSVVTISQISGVTPPNYGETPVTTITETAQFTGTVTWSDSPETFAATTVYTATITLTAKPGYTLEGLAENFFTVAEATGVTNSTDSGVITAVFPETEEPDAGDKETYTAESVSFKMAYVPGGLTFPTGENDDGTATVDDAYWIAETEVTNALFARVLQWAVNNGKIVETSGAHNEVNTTTIKYGTQELVDLDYGSTNMKISYNADTNTFAVAPGYENHPVVCVSWCGTIMFCNWLTEMFDGIGVTTNVVYTGIDETWDHAETVENPNRTGYRLPSSAEWEYAARYRNGTLWTYGDHASGDESGACYNDGSILGEMGLSTVFGNYAWYSGNSSSTHVVGTAGNSSVAACSGNSNALGLYDMSGNVWEWCSDLYSGSRRVVRGGSWPNSADDVRVGYWIGVDPNYEDVVVGFRFARTQ